MEKKRYILKREIFEEHSIKQSKIRYKDELNPAQYEAVMTLDGPVLVIAGAGTGKTRTITYRVARLVEIGVNPESILLLTFTRKAAQEMLSRASLLLDARCDRVSGGTFHSFANLTLRKYAQLLKYDNSFTILDQGDAEDVINLLRTQEGYDRAKVRFPRKQTLYEIYSKSINTETPIEEIVLNEFPHYYEQVEDIVKLFRIYNTYKAKHNLMDYDDLLLNLKRLLEEFDDVRKKLSNQYKYIMIDEYQDTNKLQADIVRLLGMEHRNVMAVGDDSQSIYAFRGANFRNIMDFPKDFPGTKIIKLEENYRSTQPILNLANEIIDRAREKYTKVLYTRKPGGELPVIVVAPSENHQSKFVVQKILELREEGIPLNQIAVLFRASYLSFDLEIELAKANIPFVKFGGFKFIETAHIKDIVAHLRVILNPNDVISWHRILLLLDGVGPRTAQKIIEDITSGKLNIKTNPKFWVEFKGYPESVSQLFKLLYTIYPDDVSVSEKTEIILRYYEPIMRDKYDDYERRKKDLEIFENIASRYDSLEEFLTDLAIEPPNESVAEIVPPGSDDEYLVLSTIHSAKGLEWNTVFIIHALDGIFPSSHSAKNDDEMEEERRLMYVACTRAKEHLFICYPVGIYDSRSGFVLTKPSRFIADLPDGLVEYWVIDEE
jgi:DNA helicase-2/ATP-dependent DNA helicase PcrA